MGVQVGVAGAGVAVVECGGQEAAGLDLLLAAVADPGQGGLGLQPRQRVGDGVVVGVLDGLPGRGRPEGPEQRGGLNRGKHQVVPGDRTPFPAGLLGRDLRPHHRRRRMPVLGLEGRQSRRDPPRPRREGW